ncbi:MAG: hypothetical protein LBV67_05075 [Streptococcaceae bacterium]|nr:hypothetical protein [Streptococcaceae bacterium]
MREYKKYSEIVLSELLADYRENFSGKVAVVQTNYKKLSEFKVMFNDDNFPHLLGLHYVTKVKYGSGIIKAIDNERITAKSIQKHHEFNARDIRKRITSYPYLYEVFYDKQIKVIVPTDNLKPNPMKLECVFSKGNENGEFVLGLRRDHVDGIFKPTTLHFSKKKKYSLLRQSKVIDIIWT